MMRSRLHVALAYDGSLDRHGGVGQIVASIAQLLTDERLRVSLLVGRSTRAPIDRIHTRSLARSLVLPFNGNRVSTPAPFPLRRRTARSVLDGVDVLHVQLPHSPFMAGRLIATASPATAVVGTFHVSSEKLLVQASTSLLARTLRSNVSRIDVFTSVSSTAAEFARRTFGVDSRVLYPPAPEPSSGTIVPGRIVFLGNLVRRKGVATLIDAYALLRTRSHLPPLIIAGDGPLRRALEKRAATRGCRSDVVFTGAVSEFGKRELLASAEIACFPSKFGESLGVVILEAIAAGAGAVITSDIPGYREIVGSHPQAIVPPDDPHGLAMGLQNLLMDPILRRDVRSAQMMTIQPLNREVAAAELLALYHDALCARRPTPRRPEALGLQYAVSG